MRLRTLKSQPICSRNLKIGERAAELPKAVTKTSFVEIKIVTRLVVKNPQKHEVRCWWINRIVVNQAQFKELRSMKSEKKKK